MVWVTQSAVDPLCIGTSIRQHGHNEEASRPDDPVEFLQRLRIVWNMFEHSTSDHCIERVVFVRYQVGVTELRIFESREIEERMIFAAINIAAINFYIRSPQHSNHTCIRSVSASPVKNSLSVFEEFLEAFKNACLTPYNRKISGMGVQVNVFFDLGLGRIEFHQFRIEIRHLSSDPP